MDCLVVALRFNNTDGEAQERDGLYEISTPLFFGLDTHNIVKPFSKICINRSHQECFCLLLFNPVMNFSYRCVIVICGDISMQTFTKESHKH